MKRLHSALRSAFTIIELLVVIAIICILCALLFPALKAANNARDQSNALSNLRQVGMAFIGYANDHSYVLPGRTTSNKWPSLLATYLSDVRVYACIYDSQNWVARGLTTAQAISDQTNNTSFIMNGYNDLGTYPTSSGTGVTIRMNAFPDTADIILLGMPYNPPATKANGVHNTQYYMDFEEPPNGNENDVLNLSTFNGGSDYLFADGSARFITQAQYNAPLVGATNSLQTYGNSLWCVNKSYVIPTVGH
jgi:prepilin-type N-terminal cleavage/methylation domain-containing protein/prepilin-type processing-associated H-X9-DG protein